jgi:hypothetical protein
VILGTIKQVGWIVAAQSTAKARLAASFLRLSNSGSEPSQIWLNLTIKRIIYRE